MQMFQENSAVEHKPIRTFIQFCVVSSFLKDTYNAQRNKSQLALCLASNTGTLCVVSKNVYMFYIKKSP